MKKIMSVGQTALLLSFVVVMIRNQFFGWESYTYVIASGGLLLSSCAWIELVKQRLVPKSEKR